MRYEQRRFFYTAALLMSALAVFLLSQYIKYKEISDAEIFMETTRTDVRGRVLGFGFQYVGSCITKQNLKIVNFSKCTVNDQVDLLCEDTVKRKYTSPETDDNKDIEWRRLRIMGRHTSSSHHCFDRYVPWLKVQVYGPEGNITRCATRFGTRLNSQEHKWEVAQAVLHGLEVGKVADFWVQIEDVDTCVVGFDDPTLLEDADDFREMRDALWSGWIGAAGIAIIIILCGEFMPDPDPTPVPRVPPECFREGSLE